MKLSDGLGIEKPDREGNSWQVKQSLVLTQASTYTDRSHSIGMKNMNRRDEQKASGQKCVLALGIDSYKVLLLTVLILGAYRRPLAD